MTDEEWKSIEAKLAMPPAVIRLKVDGYNVTITHARVNSLRFCLAIFVDDTFKMEWALNDCEIRRKFCSKHTKSLLSKKERKKLGVSDKEYQKNISKFTCDWYEPYWNSFKRMKTHLIKNSTTIELISAKG